MNDSQHKLVPFLHLPLQSGSDQILQNMKRRYQSREFIQEIQQAVDQVEGICIGTDVMVGFPGETERQFNETRKLLEEHPFHYFHVFPFSPRPGTPANKMEDQVSPETIRDRATVLRELSREKRKRANGNLIGTTQKVLFEARKPDGSQSGYTANYTRVTLQENPEQDHSNLILPVQITQLGDGMVYGVPQYHLRS